MSLSRFFQDINDCVRKNPAPADLNLLLQVDNTLVSRKDEECLKYCSYLSSH